MSATVEIRFRPDADGPVMALVDGALVRGFEDPEGVAAEVGDPSALRAPHRVLRAAGITPGGLALLTLDDEPTRVVIVEELDAARVQLNLDGWQEVPAEALAAFPDPGPVH